MARGASDMPPGVRPLTVGDPVIIGRYLLLGRLGIGGMGVVYLAEHPRRTRYTSTIPRCEPVSRRKSHFRGESCPSAPQR